uniref:Secreted protein n=1 Tax=Steinernema glaseri TaxID=37863 RepID=A0A1I8AXA4_9BILA
MFLRLFGAARLLRSEGPILPRPSQRPTTAELLLALVRTCERTLVANEPTYMNTRKKAGETKYVSKSLPINLHRVAMCLVMFVYRSISGNQAVQHCSSNLNKDMLFSCLAALVYKEMQCA